MQDTILDGGTSILNALEMRVGRNDPCPCGSGKKYKKCRGAVIAVRRRETRECGTCTACCDGWVVGTIHGHEMKPGTPCHFRGEGCCTIYERRPAGAVPQLRVRLAAPGSPFPESFRPDRLGVMIVRDAMARNVRRTSWGRRDATRTRRCSPGCASFSAQRGAPFFYEQKGERFGFGPPAFQHEMLARVESGERLW